MSFTAKLIDTLRDLDKNPLCNCPLCSNIILEPTSRNGGRRWVVSDIVVTGLMIRAGVSEAETNGVVPLSNMMRYCGDDEGLIGISMTVPVHVVCDDGLNSSTQVPGR